MMKNLLVLALVLSVVGLANAGLKIDVAGAQYADGSTIVASAFPTTVSVYNDAQYAGVPELGWLSVTLGTEGAVQVNSGNLPGVWSIDVYGDGGDGLFYWTVTNTSPAVGNTNVGNLFSVTVTGPTTFTAYLPDGATPIVSANIVTPEPITMLLLGLGGLFIRRK